MMPTDRLTIRSTIFDRSANENTAAAEMLIMPAMVVASRMEMRVGSILTPLDRALRQPQGVHCTAQLGAAHYPAGGKMRSAGATDVKIAVFWPPTGKKMPPGSRGGILLFSSAAAIRLIALMAPA
jgi:hypothetical protein